MAGLFDNNDGALLQSLLGLLQNMLQPLDDAGRSGVVEPEEDDAYWLALREGNDLTEIQIERQHNSSFCSGFRKDFSIRQTMQSFLPKVPGIVAFGPQPFDDPHSNTHVSEEPHWFL